MYYECLLEDEMGGNALQHLGVRRISVAEMAKRLDDFEYIVDKINIDDFIIHFPMPLFGKTDYGDLDVIYTCDPKNIETIRTKLIKEFKSKGFKKNGSVTSIEWVGLQVDMIYAPLEEFDWTSNWYSHGDASAIKGRIYRYYNFKFGHNGLFYNIKTKNMSKDVLVTRNWKSAHRLMDWKALLLFYMYSEENIFTYMTTCPHIHPAIYSTIKPTDRPRSSQVKFYEWIMKYFENNPNYAYKPREFGLQLLYKADKLVWLKVMKETAMMNLRERINPFRKKIRKLLYTKVYPVLFKLRGML